MSRVNVVVKTVSVTTLTTQPSCCDPHICQIGERILLHIDETVYKWININFYTLKNLNEAVTFEMQ